MKVLLYGPFGQYPKEIENQVKSLGLEIIDPSTQLGMATPDVVVTYGGDGTILGAEAAYPGIPKLPLRHSENCFHCSSLPNDTILERFAQGRVKTVEYLKLEATFGQKHFLALNEFSFRNKLPTAALRFSVSTNPLPRAQPRGIPHTPYSIPPTLIGDGIIIATPFGSTGYFYSITRKSFPKGIGLAFNNVHNFDKRLIVIPETATATISIVRGPAHFTRDNNQEILEFQQGETVTIQKAPQPAKILVLLP